MFNINDPDFLKILKGNENLEQADGEGDSERNLEELYANLYKSNVNTTNSNGENVNFKKFIPEPGFCLKTKNSKNEKVFLNICQSSSIAPPKDIGEDELLKLIEQQNQNELDNAAFHFRVPMSLGEAHNELDNNANTVVVFDVCINPQFFTKISNSKLFMSFFISIVIEGLEEKYQILLDKNYVMLKNKKFLGKIQEQYIRIKSKPIISEVETPANTDLNVKQSNNVNKADTKFNTSIGETPKYRIKKIFIDELNTKIDYLEAEIELPKVISSQSVTLDIGQDRIVLNTRSNIYHLDIFIPFSINQDECNAKYDYKTHVLTIKMPLNEI